MGPIRVVVADDDLLVREGVASLLDGSRFEVVGRAGDVTELMQLVREHLPGLVVLDIRMPPSHTTEALDAAQAIRAEFPETGRVGSADDVAPPRDDPHVLAIAARVGWRRADW